AQQPMIRVYDTGANNSNVKDIYEQAINDGAQFVVGPLTKPNVQAIVDHGCSVPTLLLNYSNSDDKLPSQCFEFAISPINEASQAAVQAWSDQDDHAIIISPQGDWGQPIAASFQSRWQSLGGRVVGELDFDSENALAQQIAALMGIQQSTQRQQALQRLLGQNVKFLPRRRDDVGVIFINATNAQARQIVPLLKFNLSGNVPMVATSLVYNGVPSPSTDNDLNGVQFLIMPWSTALNPEPQLYQELQTLWPTNFQRNSKLYALGIDSFKLLQNLNRMQLFSQIAIQGTTGKLTLQPNQQITQQMLWARFVDGRPVLLNKKSKALYGNS
ncbi:MAG: penicillin-binding protein activator, partial [Gammaproteobacteria bacterium]|nr:penicillin-binding protein activator [Gammaproteobacteria bacterium]